MLGITLSYTLDLPTAPLIVASLSAVFFLLLAVNQISRRKRDTPLSPSRRA
jgi:ABC-type Mn2+/Zn2+ transport system permease subunit